MTKAAAVGGFILGALALSAAGILFFGGMQFFATSWRVVVFFGESVAGLDVGSPVTFHGVRIGSVQSVAIRLSTDTMTARIPVYLEIQPNKFVLEGRVLTSSAEDSSALIGAGLRAQLAVQSFVTGQLRVDLDFRPGTPVELIGAIKDVPEIPAVSSELNQLRNQLAQLPLNELADVAKQAFTSLGRLSDHLDAVLDPLAARAVHAGDAAVQAMQTAEIAVQRVQADASVALHGLTALLADARRQMDSRGGELSRALVSANRTFAAADRAIGQAEALVAALNELAEPHSPFRGDLESAVRDLAASASSLRSLAEAVERNPNALLVGRSNR